MEGWVLRTPAVRDHAHFFFRRENLITWILAAENNDLGMEIQRDMMLTFGVNDVIQFDSLLAEVMNDISQALEVLSSRTFCTPFTGREKCSF